MSNGRISFSFWEDKEKMIINQKLFSDVALDLAQRIYQDGLAQQGRNKITQIRKFYDEILNLDNQLQSIEGSLEENFRRLFPYLKMLRPLVYYALGRGHVTESFKDFIEECLRNVEDYRDFRVLRTFFEAFMGYYRYFAGSR